MDTNKNKVLDGGDGGGFRDMFGSEFMGGGPAKNEDHVYEFKVEKDNFIDFDGIYEENISNAIKAEGTGANV